MQQQADQWVLTLAVLPLMISPSLCAQELIGLKKSWDQHLQSGD